MGPVHPQEKHSFLFFWLCRDKVALFRVARKIGPVSDVARHIANAHVWAVGSRHGRKTKEHCTGSKDRGKRRLWGENTAEARAMPREARRKRHEVRKTARKVRNEARFLGPYFGEKRETSGIL